MNSFSNTYKALLNTQGTLHSLIEKECSLIDPEADMKAFVAKNLPFATPARRSMSLEGDEERQKLHILRKESSVSISSNEREYSMSFMRTQVDNARKESIF